MNQKSLYIKSDGEVELTASTLFVSTQPVGSFTDSTKLTLQDPLNAHAGQHALFVVSFSPEMVLAEGEYFMIYLPEFIRLNEHELVYSLDSTFDAVNDFQDTTISLRAVRNINPGPFLNVNGPGTSSKRNPTYSG